MRLLQTLLVVAAAGGVAHAQIRGVTADATPIVGADGVRVGTTVRAALRVTLPNGFHVQSNKPRDPSLIPTSLTLEVPPTASVVEVVFPAPIDQRIP